MPLFTGADVSRKDLPWSIVKPSGDTSGVSDTAAMIAAFARTKNVQLLSGIYYLNGTVVRPSSSRLIGAGLEATEIRKVGSALSYVAADAVTYNALFVMPEDSFGHETGNFLFSNTDGTSTAIFTLLEETYDNSFFRLRGGKFFDYAIKECRDFFKTSFRDIRLNSVRHGFDFSTDKFKTSLTFDNCYAFNCGNAYVLKRAYYTSLIACAADYIAVDGTALETPFLPDGSFGSPSQLQGIYDFDECRSVSVTGCGAESSYGNGLLRVNASTIVVNGLRGYDIRSTYVPNYVTFPNFYVGPIQANVTSGTGSINLNGVDIDTWSNASADSNKQAVIAYNNNGTDPGVIVIEHGRMRLNACPSVAVGGLGATTNVKNRSTIPAYTDFGDRRIYNTKVVTGASSTLLRIPMLSQGASNRRAHCKVTMISDVSNATTVRGGVAEFSFSHLTSVANVATLAALGNVASIAANGLNIDITLTLAVTEIKIAVEFIGSRLSVDYFDYANIALV